MWANQPHQLRTAIEQGLTPQVASIQHEQVERVKDQSLRRAGDGGSESVKVGAALFVLDDHLAV
jgi:hypothetical protein